MFKRRESKEEIANRIYDICEKSFPGYQETHPDNILAPPMKPEAFVYEVIRHLLGPNWYVTYSCGINQVCTEALFDIEMKYKRVND